MVKNVSLLIKTNEFRKYWSSEDGGALDLASPGLAADKLKS